MVHFSTILKYTFVAILSNSCAARTRHVRPRGSHALPRDDIPFDGQYIDVNAQNGATEWWWFQVNGSPDPTTGVIPGLHVTFYEGYPLNALRALAGGANAPQNYIVLDIALPNGKTYQETLPAPSATITPFQGTAVQGIWNPPGEFNNFGSSVNLQVSVPAILTAQVTITSDGRGERFGCPNGPYFNSALPAGTPPLNANEQMFFEQLGWAISQTGGSAVVQLTLVNEAAVTFQGQGYHDANWMPTPLDNLVDEWYFMNAQVGPFDLTAVRARVKESSRVFNQGYLQDGSGQPLQYQCSTEGSRSTDIVTVTPFGRTVDAGVNIMQGFTLDYKLANGDEYKFTLTGQRLILDTPVYHRWVGTASGGKVGGPQYSGVTMFDWLNPSNTPYNG